MQIITDIEQGTDEWHQLRLGVPTASRFKDILAGGKGITRNNYMMQLAAEIITGKREESYTNSSMQWGTETEPQARAFYEFSNGLSVTQVAFIKHDFINVGYSPDGIISNGLIEIKCPKTTTQIETVLSGKMPIEHKPQVQGGLWLAEKEWLDFISFDPRIRTEKSYFEVRIFRDEEYIKTLEKEVIKFNDELMEIVDKMI